MITNNVSNPAAPVLTSGVGTGNQWFKDGIAINGATAANYTVNTPGVYSVKIIVADCLYATSDELTVVPFKIVNHPANLVQCVGTNATFSVEASDYGPLTYQWKKAGANITGATSSTLEINQIKAEDAAVYSVEVNGSFGPLISNEATLTVNPKTAIANQPTDLVQCSGTIASLTVEASGTGTLTYQWKKAGANIDGATSATLSLNQIKEADAAAYSVDVTGTCGMVSSGTATLTVNPLTSITTQPTDQAQCPGTNASLTVEASGTGTLTYQWKKAGANIDGATSATLALNQIKEADAAAYSVDVTSTCGMVSSSTATLTVNPLPVVTLADFAAVSTNHPAFELTGGAPTGGKYSISGATVAQFQPSAAGNYTIVYSYTEPATGCSNSASKVLTVNTATGIDDVAQISMSVKIYPNPAIDFFTLEISSPKKQEAELMIYNYGGKVVARETSILKEGVNKITFNGCQFSKGGYIVKIVTKDAVISQKLTLN